MAEQETKAKKKKPTAEKRMIQNEKKRLTNRSYKSKVRTVVRELEGKVKEKQETTSLKETLKSLFSLYDKGVKKNIIKKNKADRKKSFFSKLIQIS